MSIFSILTILFITIISLNSGCVNAASNEAKCRQWALEDGVTANKLPNYVRECLNDQTAPPEANNQSHDKETKEKSNNIQQSPEEEN